MPAPTHLPDPSSTRRGTRLIRHGARLARGMLAIIVLFALIIGIPWGLAHYIGWPLPHQLPTWAETEAVLLAPMSTSFLLNALACILWPVWAAFLLDVARATLEEIRAFPRPTMPATGPLHALAAVLVTTIVMALIQRPAPPAAAAAPVAAATAAPTATASTPGRQTQLAFAHPASAPDQIHRDSSRPGSVEVQPPREGIHDSLWRIAERRLGDGNRWPQIYALNHGRPQPDGHTLTNPNLIRPGWILRLPGHPPPSGAHSPSRKPSPPSSPAPTSPHTGATPTAPSRSPAPEASPQASRPPTVLTPTAPAAPTISTPPLPSRESPHPDGISLPTGAFVGLGLAAAISAAAVTVRLRRRVRYRPGSGKRDDLTLAPVVRALRRAHDETTRSDGPDLPLSHNPPTELPMPASVDRPTDEGPTPPSSPPVHERVIAVHDHQAVAWDLARSRGLGVIGPGALDAIRALLISLLAESPPTTSPVEILVPASDAHRLIGEHTDTPPRLRIVDDLDAALDVMESELLTRTRIHTSPDTALETSSPAHSDLVLITTPAPHAERRLQALLDNGSTLGLAGILFGQWRPGATVRVRPDGTVAATSPSLADTLTGARLFTLPTYDAQALLDLLNEAQPATPPPTPRSSTLTALGHSASGDRGPGTARALSPPRPSPPHDRVADGPSTALHTRQPAGSTTDPSPADRDAATHRDAPLATAEGDDRPRAALAPPAPSLNTPPAAASADPTPGPDTKAITVHTGSGARATVAPSPPLETSMLPTEESSACRAGLEPEPSLKLAVLGPLRLTHHHADDAQFGDVTDALAPRQREVLAYLALHQGGAQRDILSTALWPDAPRDRPFNAFHATLSQLRRALRTATHDAVLDVTVNHDGHYTLDARHVSVDLWQLRDALDESRRSIDEHTRRVALEHAVDLYGDDLAADLTAEWLEAPREALRRDILDALSALVATIRDSDPRRALVLLERTRSLDPYNETLYCDIARLQAELGQHDAISRTLALLSTTFAEIDTEPSPESIALCTYLQRQRRHTRPAS